MESGFHGVPISATQMSPEAASSYRGIRAPLTVDESDVEHSFSSQRNSTTSSYYSGSELESEGYESGENEVEKDEGVLVETHLLNEFAVSEHSLRSPDEEFGQESVNVSGNDVFRPFVRIPDGKMYKGSSIVDDSDDAGSFLSDSGDELVKDETFVAHLGDSRPLVAVRDEAVVDVRLPTVQKLHIPIAQISADSDDDSQISGVSDAEDFAGIVRVPSIEILRRIDDSAPKVRVVETEGAEKMIEMEFVDDLVNSDDVLGSLEEMEDVDVKTSINCSVSADLVLDKGLDIDEEDTNNSLVVDEAFDSTLESGKNEDLLHLGLEVQESDVVDEGNRSEKVESENEDDIISTVEFFSSIDCSVSADLVLDEGLDIDEDDTNNSLVVDEEFDSTLESGKNGDHLHLGLEIQEIDEGNQSEKVESKNEHEIVSTVSSDAVDEISSVHQCVDIMEVPIEALPIFPKPLTESMTVYTSESLFKDSSWSSVIDGGESDPETRKEAVKSDGETMNSIQDSTSFSDHSREIDSEFKEASSETKNKIEQMGANYLGLLCSLGQSPVDSKDLYQLTLSHQSSFSQELHLASIEPAMDGLDFSLSILVIGNTGVGKSATINSIFGETKVTVDAFEPSTPRVKEIVGTINGVKLKVFDTPGFRTCSMDQSINRKILSSIKKVMQISPPDVILYIDRLDTRTSHHDLKSITSYLGPSVWRKSIIVFTHGASIPPDGCPLEYVAQKSRAVRQIISPSMVPVCVVENHPFVETLLHNGERWRSEFLLLCCSMKILSECKNVPPPKLSSSFLQSDNVAPDVAPCCSFRHRSLVASTGWDHRGIADHFPATITVRFSKNVTAAAFDDHLCVRTRCSDARMAGLWLVPIVKKMLGED